MELEIHVVAPTRSCLLRGVHELAVGDVYSPLVVDGVAGADLPSLTAVLKASDGSVVAKSGPFSMANAWERSRARCTLSLASPDAFEWAESLSPADSSYDNGLRPDDVPYGSPPLRHRLRLELFDSSRTYVACDVPVLIRTAVRDD